MKRHKLSFNSLLLIGMLSIILASCSTLNKARLRVIGKKEIYYYQKAENAAQRHVWYEAVNLYQQAIEAESRPQVDYYPYMKLGEVYLALGKLHLAEESCKTSKARAVAPQDELGACFKNIAKEYKKIAPTATPEPTVAPTTAPTVAPTTAPTAMPEPTVAPTTAPTVTPEPTVAPTTAPTVTPEPTVAPTTAPTVTLEPTVAPTTAPTAMPEPTVAPTIAPTATPEPTVAPTVTLEPTVAPITAPTAMPEPTVAPTTAPTAMPEPTVAPTTAPTAMPEPTVAPTTAPTAMPEPTVAPTTAPTAMPEPTVAEELPEKTPEETSEASEELSEVYAAIIGIGKFEDERIPQLRFTTNDARGFYEVLTDPNYGSVPKEHVKLLLNEDATSQNIKSTIGTWLKRQAGENDRVIIYYAGHGATEGQETYWVTYEADIDDLYATALNNNTIADMLSRIQTRRMITFLDSCYSAATVNRENQTRDFATEIPWEKFSGEGHVTISASKGTELSLELSAYKHGVFTYYLLEGLKGRADGAAGKERDGIVELDEVWNFVKNNVTETSRKQGNTQTPVFQGTVTAGIPLTLDLQFLKHLEQQKTEQIKEKQIQLKAFFAQGKIEVSQFDCAFQMLERGESNGYLDGFLAGEISPATFNRVFDCGAE